MNGQNLNHQSSRPELQKRSNTFESTRSNESYLVPTRLNALNRKDSSISETGSAPDSLLDLYGGHRSGMNSIDYGDRKPANSDTVDPDPEHSRWIHRDKLARIESQELQAAGIILPRARAPSKSNRVRDHSSDHHSNGVRSEQPGKRQRMESFPTEEEEAPESNEWDLRLPDEVAEDQGDIYRDIAGLKGVSRIPVCKTSPLPVPIEHLARDTPMRRKQSTGWTGEEDSISYPKSRIRSESLTKAYEATVTPTPAKRLTNENSPTKKPTPRKSSLPGSRGPSANQKPKPRPRDTSAQRPPTRTGEVRPPSSLKAPEGDPPWIQSMYKPDPRLPPDQQLLPTVAKRLQQEQWEREGKFGNVYDTNFRPLNDEELKTPEPVQTADSEQKPEESGDWPLRSPKSPALSTGRPGTAGGYSTRPKITGTPQGVSLPNPPVRVANPPEAKEKGGCGCCAVM
jgi:hypothetical protein